MACLCVIKCHAKLFAAIATFCVAAEAAASSLISTTAVISKTT